MIGPFLTPLGCPKVLEINWSHKSPKNEKNIPRYLSKEQVYQIQPNPFLGSLCCPIGFRANLGPGAQK